MYKVNNVPNPTYVHCHKDLGTPKKKYHSKVNPIVKILDLLWCCVTNFSWVMLHRHLFTKDRDPMTDQRTDTTKA